MKNTLLSKPPLTLTASVFTHIHIESHECELFDGNYSFSVTRTTSEHKEDPLDHNVSLTVEVGTKDVISPYKAKIQIEGFFKVDPNYPKNRISRLVEVNGASILYGSCREMLISLTARGPHGVLSLLSVAFLPSEPAPESVAQALPEKSIKNHEEMTTASHRNID